MKRMLVLLVVLLVLFSGCASSPSAPQRDDSIQFGELWDSGTEDYIDLLENENKPGTIKALYYSSLDYRVNSDYDWFYFFVRVVDTTDSTYDPANPYRFGFSFTNNDTFQKDDLTQFVVESSSIDQVFELTSENGFSGPANITRSERHSAGATWKVDSSLLSDLATTSEITITLKGTKNGDIVRTIPVEFSEYLAKYF